MDYQAPVPPHDPAAAAARHSFEAAGAAMDAAAEERRTTQHIVLTEIGALATGFAQALVADGAKVERGLRIIKQQDPETGALYEHARYDAPFWFAVRGTTLVGEPLTRFSVYTVEATSRSLLSGTPNNYVDRTYTYSTLEALKEGRHLRGAVHYSETALGITPTGELIGVTYQTTMEPHALRTPTSGTFTLREKLELDRFVGLDEPNVVAQFEERLKGQYNHYHDTRAVRESDYYQEQLVAPPTPEPQARRRGRKRRR